MDIRKEELRFRIWRATPAFIIQVITVISRCPHPVVYLFSMLGIIASKGSITAIINLRRGCNGNPAWHHGVRGRDWHPDCVGHHLQVSCGLVIYPITYERALRVRHHLQVWSGFTSYGINPLLSWIGIQIGYGESFISRCGLIIYLVKYGPAMD